MHPNIAILLGLAIATSGLVAATIAPADPALGATDRLLALQRASPAGLDRAVALAAAATAEQAALAGVALPPVEVSSHAAPSEAAAALLASRGVEASGLDALDALAEPARSGVLKLLDASLAYQAAAAALPEAGPVLAARDALLDAARQFCADAPRDDLHLVAAPALAIDLVGVDDAYAADVAFSFDVAGNDVYTNNAGGSHLLGAAAAVDCDGDDSYVAERGQGVNGGGWNGAGFLFDASGDDVYRARDDGSNGGAYIGAVGFLLDAGGFDRYEAWGWGANGGTYPGGFGMILDDGGSDTYSGMYEGVNGGTFGGNGFLYDTEGDDVYVAEFAGTNGGAFGGRGLLLDGGGNDAYTAESGGVNGGGDVGGVGLLRDVGGTDVYADLEGGSGVDRTVVPKGLAGFQVDESG